MNRIDTRFQTLRAANHKGFIAYIAAGDPSLAATAALTREFDRIGVDVVELGVPFSDPLADGIVNQLAAERGLRSGTTLAGVIQLVAQLRRDAVAVPIVFYIYYNLIHRYGLERFVRDAATAGVDGVLALDLPPEEGASYERLMRQHGVHPIYLIAPTTPPARVRAIARHASGFIYYVSREGVTGMQQTVVASIRARVSAIRRQSKLPVAVGFGIATPAQAKSVAADADAVVVGSAIVNQIATLGNDRHLARKIGAFVAPLLRATRHAGS